MVGQLRPRDQAGTGTGRALHQVHHSFWKGDFALEIFINGIICLPNCKLKIRIIIIIFLFEVPVRKERNLGGVGTSSCPNITNTCFPGPWTIS